MSLWLVRKLWRNPDSLKWLEAIYRLKCFKWLEAIKHTQCFDDKIEILLICKNSFTPIGCKFVLRIKTIKHEIVFTHKARLVAKGYKQIHDVDCVETSCKIVMLKSIIQAMIAYWYIWQLDDKTYSSIKCWKKLCTWHVIGFVNPNKYLKRKASLWNLSTDLSKQLGIRNVF